MLVANLNPGSHDDIAPSFLDLTVVRVFIGVISPEIGSLDDKRQLRTVYPKTPTLTRSTLSGQG